VTPYPSHLARTRSLKDGRAVTIRPVREDDEAKETAFFSGLSERARRLRFQRRTGAPDEGLMHFFTHIDYARHMAFVCEFEGALVGDARYLANADGRSSEFGIVVAAAWHHTGIAQLLMDALIRAAQARGFETMEGLVLRDNGDMLDFVKQLGFEAVPAQEDPATVRVVRKL
jgi:acetyltransferase